MRVAPEFPVLTLYAFSSDNWRRPGDEVSALMTLFRRYLASEVSRCVETGIRLSIVGRRDRLAPTLVSAIEAAEEATRARHRHDGCGSRSTTRRATRSWKPRGAAVTRKLTRERFATALARRDERP